MKPNRPPCPYFGFHLVPGMNIMMDSDGNQCALELRSLHPCDYFLDGEVPDWNSCHIFNVPQNEQKLAVLEAVAVVFPREIGNDGIPLADWKKMILDDGIPS